MRAVAVVLIFIGLVVIAFLIIEPPDGWLAWILAVVAPANLIGGVVLWWTVDQNDDDEAYRASMERLADVDRPIVPTVAAATPVAMGALPTPTVAATGSPPTAPRRSRVVSRGGSDGCVIQLVAVGLLGLAIAALVAVYVAYFGTLPFTWADGPFGTPVWAPAVVLGLVTAAAAIAPRVWARLAPTRTFYDQIAANRRNSVWLTIAITAGMGLAVYAIAATVTLRTSWGLTAAAIAMVTTLVVAALSFASGDHIVLAVSRARPASPSSDRILLDVVQELSIAAQVPPPAVYVIEGQAPNAFSIGRDPDHACLAVTSGLLSAFDREELQGVIAHELAHIRNQDSRYSLFVAVLVGATVLVADGFFKAITFPFQVAFWMRDELRSEGDPSRRQVSGSGSGGSWSLPDLGGGEGSGGGGDLDLGDGDSGSGGAAALILAVIIFVLLVFLVALVVKTLSPLFARLEQAATSREREFLADATAVELGRNPGALERALLKASRSTEVLEAANRATAPLYFVTPIRAFERRAAGIYATHPPTIDRVNRLRLLQGQPPMSEAELDSGEDLD